MQKQTGSVCIDAESENDSVNTILPPDKKVSREGGVSKKDKTGATNAGINLVAALGVGVVVNIIIDRQCVQASTSPLLSASK